MADDPLIEALEGILSDPTARPSTRVTAAKELGALRRANEQHPPAADNDDGEPLDPFIDLDVAASTGLECDSHWATRMRTDRPTCFMVQGLLGDPRALLDAEAEFLHRIGDISEAELASRRRKNAKWHGDEA